MLNKVNREQDDGYIETIKNLKKQLKEAKSNQLGRLVLPKFNGDPPDVQDGELWYDTATDKSMKREAGVSKNMEDA